MNVLRAATVALILSAVATVGLAQDKKAVVDPSGTWRWDFEINGETIKNVLKLDAAQDGKVTGNLEARDRKMDVADGQFKDGKLTFKVQAESPRTFTILFDGKIDGDKIEGELSAKSDDGSREFPWTAQRSVEPSDVVGTWQLKIVTPNDRTLKPILTFANKAQELTATYVAEDGKSIEVKGLTLKDNQLQFEIDTEVEGSKLHVAFKGRPYGSKLKGSLKYTLNGESGELEYSGTLQAEKKS